MLFRLPTKTNQTGKLSVIVFHPKVKTNIVLDFIVTKLD